MKTPEYDMAAVDRGAADFLAGRNMNPYDYYDENLQFHSWLFGYRTARTTQELFS